MLKRVLIAGAILTASASVAQAQGYVGASIGQSEVQEDCDGTVTCDLKDTGFKVFGGYMFTPNFGVEAGYVDLGKAKVSLIVPTVIGNLLVNGDYKASGFGVWGKAAYPIGDFSLFGKLGFAYLETELTASNPAFGSVSVSESNADFAWGLGGAYHFTKNFGVRLEYERFRAELEGEKSDVDLLSAGIVYRF